MRIIFFLLTYLPAVVSASAPSIDNDASPRAGAGNLYDVEQASNSAMALFATGSASLSPAAKDAIAPLVKPLRHSVIHRFRITGYADSRGSKNDNMTLSLRRAINVKEHLIELGVHPDRIEITAFGEARAAINVQDTEALVQDRRVVIRVDNVPPLARAHLAIGK